MAATTNAMPVGQHLTKHAEELGDKTAVIFAAEDSSEQEISWRQLEQRANQTARLLADMGWAKATASSSDYGIAPSTSTSPGEPGSSAQPSSRSAGICRVGSETNCWRLQNPGSSSQSGKPRRQHLPACHRKKPDTISPMTQPHSNRWRPLNQS